MDKHDWSFEQWNEYFQIYRNNINNVGLITPNGINEVMELLNKRINKNTTYFDDPDKHIRTDSVWFSLLGQRTAYNECRKMIKKIIK